MLAKEPNEPDESRQGADSVIGELETKFGQGPKSYLDEESIEEENVEPAVNNQGRKYPLRERRSPHRFPDEERVLLTDEGEPESIEEAKRNSHYRKWLSAM